MQWEQLTAPDFAKAVTETGVCLLALGVLERHSSHLPLGTDMLNVHKLATQAAIEEPAVVFPPFYFGQIYEATCFPGAFTIKPTLLIDLLQSVLDEIGRNGFKKIILVNGHGGNHSLLGFLAQMSLWEQKPYTVYLFKDEFTPEESAAWKALLETEQHGHACECETSITMANYPELVKMEDVEAEPALPLGRARDVPGAYLGVSWYANYPEHYAGDARTANAEKGAALAKLERYALVRFIRAVKADRVMPALEAEFFNRKAQLRKD
ncbi:MAG: creatininase family protein [Chloroflexi bacterium]|nr:creatininase family protein [Chloroflexota bacterium]